MRTFPWILFLLTISLAAAADRTPRVRPPEWAAPVIDTTLENCFRVSDELLRCEQPRQKDIADLHALGVRSVLNLRRHHRDPESLEKAGFTLLVQRTEADDLTVDDLVAALRQFRDAPKPLIVHCWHGSDRTGSFVAAYRIVFHGWTREAALDEFRHGGYGFHEKWFPNLLTLLGGIDEDDIRRRVRE